jgi:hypothetical protein
VTAPDHSCGRPPRRRSAWPPSTTPTAAPSDRPRSACPTSRSSRPGSPCPR